MDSIEECAFVGCDLLQKITVSEDNLYFKSINGVLYNKSITELIACPNGLKGALTIQPTTEQLRNHSIAFCKQISSITIPTKMNHIGDYTFEGCYNCLLYTSPSPRDLSTTRMPDSA